MSKIIDYLDLLGIKITDIDEQYIYTKNYKINIETKEIIRW